MKVAEKRKQLMDKMKNNLDFKVAIIQELIPLGLERVAEELKKEVGELAGKRYQHDSENVMRKMDCWLLWESPSKE